MIGPNDGLRISIPLATLLAAWTFAATALAQPMFVDDAGRRVVLPATIDRVFAAGAPAEVLLYTLVPDKLAGRNHLPSPAALELMPPELRNPVAITNLPERDDARYDTELLALDVDVYVDYGTVDEDYIAALEAISSRTQVAGIILDGRLAEIPAVYRKLGAALGVPERGAALAAETERLLDAYRDRLSAAAPRVFLACSQNGFMPCLAGHSFGEAAEWLGATNVAGHVSTSARRPLTVAAVRELAPDVIIAASADAAAALLADAEWRTVAAVAAGRVHAPPTVPFNWGPRPPSVNRLAGLIWLAYVVPGRPFDDAFYADVASLFHHLYHVTPTREQLRALVAPPD